MAAFHPPAHHITRAASTAPPLQSKLQDDPTLPKSDSEGVGSGSKRGHFGVKKGSLWGRFGVGFFGPGHVRPRRNFLRSEHLIPPPPHKRPEKLIFTPTPPRPTPPDNGPRSTDNEQTHMDLFAESRKKNLAKAAPLAARMRPRTLEEFTGQQHFLGPGKLLRRMLEADRLSSVIFYGPPGTGKTTLAQLIAHYTRAHFEQV